MVSGNCDLSMRHEGTVYGIDSRFTPQCNVTLYVYADLYSLPAATSQYSVLIGQKMQLTGCHNGNEKRNATCAASKTSKVPTQDALLFLIL